MLPSGPVRGLFLSTKARALCPVFAVAILLSTGCASALAFTPSGQDARADRARQRLARVEQRREDARPFDSSVLPSLDTELLESYTHDVSQLGSPEMDGRLPGTPGIEMAAHYIEGRFRDIGLAPAFDGAASYRQPMTRGKRSHDESGSLTADLGMDQPSLRVVMGEALGVLGESGTGSVAAPLVFVGYSIAAGPDGYLGYAPGDDLEGKIAVILTREPHNADGDSRWAAPGKWSYAAAMPAKLTAAKRRNAEAIILAHPPALGGDDLFEFNPEPITWFDEVPVVMISTEACDRLVRAADEHGRSLQQLTELANAGGVAVDLPRVSPTIEARVDRSDLMTDNIGGVLPGRGELADEVLVVGGHYDHIGHGPAFSRAPDRAGEIHCGADDNASGVAGVLQIAKQLTDAYNAMPADQPRRTVLFLAFTAEESGLHGSRYYTDHPIAPIETHTLMLNLDMIGRLRNGTVQLGGRDTADWLDALTKPAIEHSALRVRELKIGWGRSDHANFYAAGVPCLVMFTGLHDEYHTPDDTVNLVEFDGGSRIADLGASFMLAAATRPPGPTIEKLEPEERTQPRVRLGLIPTKNYGEPGVLVRRVFDDTSASAGGLESGDVIVKWDDQPIESLDDLSKAILYAEPDQTVTITIQRNDEQIEKEVTLQGLE